MQISSSFTRLSMALFIAVAALLLASTQPAEAVQLGLPWGASDNLAAKLVRGNSNFKWYMNWGNSRPVATLNELQYVPTFWGPSKAGAFRSLERYYRSHGKRPKYMLAQNEPDVPTQSNVSPRAAAHQWMKLLRPWQRRGTKVGSPQLCWDITNWLEPFLRELNKLGGKPDFCAAHYYGPANNMKRFKQYVRRLRSTCRKHGIKKVWLTEIGIMASSHPSQGEVNNFAQEAFRWLNSQSYVKRGAWIGVFRYDEPYDGFMSRKNAYFNSDGTLRTLARILSWGNVGRRSMARHSAHAAIAERISEEEGTQGDLLARADDPRGQWDEHFADEHDPDDDAYWDAKHAKEDAEDPDDDDDDATSHDDDDDFADGFLADLPEEVVPVA
ncbi:hypothetical protein OC842_004884 [Tilletia horrida]|uniref:Asl1-like glycosyl hydrolase catalytic domain-containing protein n=1 Tax=Tilletia horrida TaxID=155126 RepID=A0AAN6G8W6_9BASI|nr:hypothetical protein OC842_004884 [Tilletia horrida]